MFHRHILPFACLLSLAACTPPGEPVAIAFDVVHGERPLRCDGEPALTDLRFFVHDVELLTANGEAAPLGLDVVSGWQSGRVALVDLEDGSARCLNGTAATRRVVTGTVRPGEYAGLRFVVGVPAELNHADPLAAEPPLTSTAMHWHWRSGYKFLRAGLAAGGDGAWLHLGSARCRGVIGRLEGCDAGNLVDVSLPRFRPGTDVILLDLERLFAGADFGDGRVSSCQMGPGEPLCRAVLAALGVDPESGARREPAPAFRRRAE